MLTIDREISECLTFRRRCGDFKAIFNKKEPTNICAPKELVKVNLICF